MTMKKTLPLSAALRRLVAIVAAAALSALTAGAQGKYVFPEAVAPIVQTEWAQWFPYNKFCPTVTIDSTEQHVYAGCAPLVMSQLLRACRYSAGSKRLGRRYNWQLMPNRLDTATYAAQNAVAQLIRDCGTAANTNYRQTASATKLNDVVAGLKKFFGLSRYMHVADRSHYTGAEGDLQWKQLIFSELKAGRPVIVRGQKGRNFAHVFLIDGCRDSTVHVNFGWGGRRNGYYDPDTLYGFTAGQRMVVECAPAGYQPRIRRIVLEKAGQLHRFVSEGDWTTLHHVKVVGLVNAADIALLRQLAGGGRKGERNGQLATIDLTETVAIALPDSAFCGCASLTMVALPAMLPAVSGYAFANCPLLNQVTFHPLVRTIGQRAFSGCFCLTSLTLPRSLRAIGANAFNSCNSLSEVTLPDHVATVGSGAFANCRRLATLSAARSTRLTAASAAKGTKVTAIRWR